MGWQVEREGAGVGEVGGRVEREPVHSIPPGEGGGPLPLPLTASLQRPNHQMTP